MATDAENGLASVIATMTDEIRSRVLEIKTTVAGRRLAARYCNGRVSWDDKKLMGFAAGVPAILAFKKEGKPFVQIASTDASDAKERKGKK
jgi:hypothetical protein